MFFDINYLNRVLFDFNVSFYYIYNKYQITIKNNKCINYNLNKHNISKENLLILFPILIEEYVYFEDNPDRIKDLMCFYNSY